MGSSVDVPGGRYLNDEDRRWVEYHLRIAGATGINWAMSRPRMVKTRRIGWIWI